MIGAEAITETIQRAGVGTVFALAGAQHTRLLDTLQNAGVRIIGNRTEDAVIEAADGYARISGRPGVALIISGQGIVNAVAGVASAFEAGSPVVVIMARSPFGDDPRDSPWHGSTDVVEPVCKWYALVQRAEDLGEYLQAAMEIALAPRPGPVLLSVPADFFSADVTPDSRRRTLAGYRSAARPNAADVSEAVRLLQEAKRPLVVAGTGYRRSGDSAGLAELALRLKVPVMLQSEAKGLLENDGECVFSWPVAQHAAKSADVVLLLGCPLDHRLGGGRSPRLAPDARIIQVDADPAELGRGRGLNVAMAADPVTALADILAELDTVGFKAPDAGWVAAKLDARLAAIEAVPSSTEGGVHPYAISRRLSAVIRGPAIYVGDGADILNWTHAELHVPRGSVWMDHHPLGSMGVGLPMALGACAAEQEHTAARRPVILITGDGALGYNIMELETAVRCGLPIRVIVSNDGGWGTERHGQIKLIGHSVNTELSVARYDVVAQGLGAGGFLANTEAELEAGLDQLLALEGPGLLNVQVDRDSGGLRKREPLLETIFYDEFALQRATRP